MADMFSGMKKVKKTKKAVSFDELDAPSQPAAAPVAPPSIAQIQEEPSVQEQVDTVRPLEANADLTVADSDELDLSSLKKKKKSKKVALDLDLEGSTDNNLAAAAEEAPNGVEPAGVVPPVSDSVMDDFSDLKKKKKKSGKSKAFDLEAFEKELAATEEAAKDGDAAGSGDEANDAAGMDEDEVPEGEDPFAKDGTAAGEDGSKSKAELAYEKKAWISEDRDYQYGELLGRFYSLLYASHPSLSGGSGKKRYTIPPPSMHRDGNKRSIFANIADICKKMHRSPEHVIQFVFAELGTTGSVDGSGRLVIKGRFQQKQMENVLRRYIIEYVTCKTCKSPDTLLEKDNRIYFVTCQSCMSRRSVTSITSGYKAQVGKRKAMAANQG